MSSVEIEMKIIEGLYEPKPVSALDKLISFFENEENRKKYNVYSVESSIMDRDTPYSVILRSLKEYKVNNNYSRLQSAIEQSIRRLTDPVEKNLLALPGVQLQANIAYSAGLHLNRELTLALANIRNPEQCSGVITQEILDETFAQAVHTLIAQLRHIECGQQPDDFVAMMSNCHDDNDVENLVADELFFYSETSETTAEMISFSTQLKALLAAHHENYSELGLGTTSTNRPTR